MMFTRVRYYFKEVTILPVHIKEDLMLPIFEEDLIDFMYNFLGYNIWALRRADYELEERQAIQKCYCHLLWLVFTKAL